MGSSPQRPIRYRFGPFDLDPAEGGLSRNGNRVKLQDLPFRLLVLLVERPGEIVTREEVKRHLWPENTFVEFDNSLGVAVRKLREALHDDADAPRFVETVPRKGYRFLAPVTIQDISASEVLKPQPEKGIRYGVIAGLILLLVGAAVYELRPAPHPSSSTAEAGGSFPPARIRRSVAVMGFRNLPGRPEENWLSAAFSEMLSTELAAGGRLRLVSGEDVARAKRELPLADEDTLAKATLQRLHANPGADVVIVGSYTLLPGRETTASAWISACKTRLPGRPSPRNPSPGVSSNSSNWRPRPAIVCARVWESVRLLRKALMRRRLPFLQPARSPALRRGPSPAVGI